MLQWGLLDSPCPDLRDVLQGGWAGRTWGKNIDYTGRVSASGEQWDGH